MALIAHISDLHVGSLSFREELILNVIDRINEMGVDATIVTGDLSDNGYYNELKQASEYLEQFKTPLLVVPGNHDSRHLGNICFEELIKDRYGTLKVKNHGFKVIGLDSSEPDLNFGKVGRSQQSFMEKAMKNASKEGLFKIIALHHHIIPVPRTGRERNVLSDAGDILMSLIENKADLVLSGHKHVPHTWIVHETVFATAGTVSSFKLRGKDTPSFNTINIDEEHIDILLNTADGETHPLAKYENRCR
ncbi:metallophosphoesterase [Methanobacterium formicicum]|uniref:Metallophosphoesterase n=1 Tax=Methanobacterium formicicum (strain DSM 3637 / PP1) TaxID=1204725 RepID=K2R5K0_METFP|nr:metallophosphoesterase [Methanobacterium formicicum]EKF86497.1 metallophosphoesterase [Methanobacterium formicicum DSM 3637]